MNSFYEPSLLKRKRRTKAEIDTVKGEIYMLLDNDNPMTVRQCFYRLVSTGTIDKTEGEYKNICRYLSQLRMANIVPFEWIADTTRWMRKPRSDDDIESALRRTSETYRRALWRDQSAYVEVWLEKDALAGVLYEITEHYDVPLMVTRGYPSLSFVHAAAEAISVMSKPVHLYYFGDHDPSGVDIPRKVEERIREFAPMANITFNRVAVDENQIIEFNLPTRPTKKSDSRSKNFKGESVEVDAIPPDLLKGMAAECIERHIDAEILARTRMVENYERASLNEFMNAYQL